MSPDTKLNHIKDYTIYFHFAFILKKKKSIISRNCYYNNSQVLYDNKCINKTLSFMLQPELASGIKNKCAHLLIWDVKGIIFYNRSCSQVWFLIVAARNSMNLWLFLFFLLAWQDSKLIRWKRDLAEGALWRHMTLPAILKNFPIISAMLVMHLF